MGGMLSNREQILQDTDKKNFLDDSVQLDPRNFIYKIRKLWALF